MMSSEDYEEWTGLQKLLSEVKISNNTNEIAWGLSSTKNFTTNSLYKFITSGGISCRMTKRIWKCKVTLKIRIWQINLSTKSGRGGSFVSYVKGRKMWNIYYFPVPLLNLAGHSGARPWDGMIILDR
jgi:hypothetical protein